MTWEAGDERRMEREKEERSLWEKQTLVRRSSTEREDSRDATAFILLMSFKGFLGLIRYRVV